MSGKAKDPVGPAATSHRSPSTTRPKVPAPKGTAAAKKTDRNPRTSVSSNKGAFRNTSTKGGAILDIRAESLPVRNDGKGAAGIGRKFRGEAGLVLREVTSIEELLRGMAQAQVDMAELGIGLLEQQADEFAAVGQEIADGLRQLFAEGFPEGGFDVADAVQAIAAPQLWEQRLGGLLSPAEYSEFVDKSRQAVQQQITNGSLLAARDRNGRWRIPRWQVGMAPDARKALVTATRLLVEEGRMDPWSALAWTTAPHPEAAEAKPHLMVSDPAGAGRVLELARHDAHAASR
jgi:hypothetical protein